MAINREKELKKWNRQKKEDLINKKNPEWKELVDERGLIRSGWEVSRFAPPFPEKPSFRRSEATEETQEKDMKGNNNE